MSRVSLTYARVTTSCVSSSSCSHSTDSLKRLCLFNSLILGFSLVRDITSDKRVALEDARVLNGRLEHEAAIVKFVKHYSHSAVVFFISLI